MLLRLALVIVTDWLTGWNAMPERVGTAPLAFDQSPSWDPITPPPDPGYRFDQILDGSPGPRVAALVGPIVERRRKDGVIR